MILFFFFLSFNYIYYLLVDLINNTLQKGEDWLAIDHNLGSKVLFDMQMTIPHVYELLISKVSYQGDD